MFYISEKKKFFYLPVSLKKSVIEKSVSKKCHEKSVSQNIQNIFFVLKLSKKYLLAYLFGGAGAGGGGA